MPLPQNLPFREFVVQEAKTGKGKQAVHTRVINRRNRKRRKDGEIVLRGEKKTRFDLPGIENLIVSLMAGDYQIVSANGEVTDGAIHIVRLQQEANKRRQELMKRVRVEQADNN